MNFKRKVIYNNPFDDYIFLCWRQGKKTKDIINGWNKNVSEKEVQERFKFIVNKYFELTRGD